MIEIPTIYRLAAYSTRPPRLQKYPTYGCRCSFQSYYKTKEEALETMQKDYTRYHSYNIWDYYCLVLSEMPMGIAMIEGESFSDQLYLPDGTLWSERSYAYEKPWIIPSPYSEIEFDNYIYGKGAFFGRRNEEIRFQRGDIIEIFCYEGNFYWGGGRIELAIVVSPPPTIEEMTERIEKYLKTDPYLTGDRDFDIGIHFNAGDDAYLVIPAYQSLHDDAENLTDHCPTHCAFKPRLKVSTRMRNKLLRQLERYESTKKK